MFKTINDYLIIKVEVREEMKNGIILPVGTEKDPGYLYGKIIMVTEGSKLTPGEYCYFPKDYAEKLMLGEYGECMITKESVIAVIETK